MARRSSKRQDGEHCIKLSELGKLVTMKEKRFRDDQDIAFDARFRSFSRNKRATISIATLPLMEFKTTSHYH